MPSATKTIKPAGGGDYTTLQTWANAVKTSGGIQTAECYAGNLGALNTSGWTSAAVITVVAGARHNGIDSGTSGIAFVPSNFDVGATSITWDDTALTSIAIRHLYTQESISIYTEGGNGQFYTIEGCLLKATAGQPFTLIWNNFAIDDYSLGLYLQNNVMRSTGVSGGCTFIQVYDLSGDPATVVEISGRFTNNTLVGSGTGFYLEIASFAGTNTVDLNVQNNAVFNDGVCYSYSLASGGGVETFTGTWDYNAGRDGTATSNLGGTHNLDNQTAADWFTSSPTNMSLLSTSPGRNAGTIAAGFFGNFDINGVTRPQELLWDIGAFEFVPVPTGPRNPFIYVSRVF